VKETRDADWLSILVGTFVPILAALTSPWISLPVALVSMLVLAVVYRRRSAGYRAGAVLAVLGAAIIAAAMVVVWMRGHR
jgi:hypothetical protein